MLVKNTWNFTEDLILLDYKNKLNAIPNMEEIQFILFIYFCNIHLVINAFTLNMNRHVIL